MKITLYTLVAVLMLSSMSLFAQDKYGSTPEQQLACKEALSLYRSFRDQKQYKDAYMTWQRTCKSCPPKVSERVYSDGVKFVKMEYKNSNDPVRKEALLDSMFMIYEQRMEHFPTTKRDANNGCDIKGMMASELMKYRKDLMLDEASAMLKESVYCTKENSSAAVISSYYISLYERLKLAEDENLIGELKSQLLTEYLQLQDFIDYKINAYSDKIESDDTDDKQEEKLDRSRESYIAAKDNLDEIFLVVANCDEMVPILKDKLAADPENIDLKGKALRLMNKKDCTDNDMFLKLAEDVHAASPTHPSAYSLAIGYAKERELSKALQFIEQAVKLCGDCPEKENYMLKAGQIASALNQSGKAMGYANKVLELNPNSGEAYLLKGDAIVSTAKGCDDGGIAMRAVYIQAADYYLKAKNVDSAVASKANSKYSQAKGQWPSVEELFKANLKAGSSFTIPCSGASVTLKTRD